MSLELMCIVLFLIMLGSMTLDAFLFERIEKEKKEGEKNVKRKAN